MDSVFILWHIHADDGSTDEKLIGVYKTRDDAEAAICRLQDKPGFRDTREGFEVHAYVLGRDGWTEGYISQTEAVDDPIAAFATEARRYRALIEDDSAQNSWMFARDCLIHVSRLYERALLLPCAEPATSHVLSRVDQAAWRTGMERVERRLVKEAYWEILEPLEKDQPEATLGSISDDLVDIWRDVTEGLLEMDRGSSSGRNDAGWHWRFSFESHWSHHAVRAIGALNALCFGRFADPNRPQDDAAER